MVLTPKKIDGLSNVKAIAAGANFSLALLEDGTVRAWGGNNSGQLGDGDADPDAKLVERYLKGISVSAGGGGGGVKARAFKALEGTGGAEGPTYTLDRKKGLELGYVVVNLTGIVKVSSLNNVNMIDAGTAHAIALRKDSTVWTWGNNYWGMLGTGDRVFHTGATRVTGLDGILWVAAGGVHSFAIEKGGVVNAWGNNAHKQLGMGSVPETVATEGEEFAKSPVSVPKP
jgi:alpha-tubulin suppressor-like RCC1 family protein